MTQTNVDIINFKAIRLEVDDLELSIEFYQKLGCIIEDVENTNYGISVYLRFSRNSDVLIRLVKDFRRKEKLTTEEKRPIFEIVANQEDNHFHDELFFELQDCGIEYLNKRHENGICSVGQFEDILGHRWDLIDDFDYPED